MRQSSTEKEYWDAVVSAAETRIRNCFSSTFFQERNISIPDQQARCFNLCYALSKSGRVTRRSHVAIVGAGISGMTCAVALTMATDCLVYVYERDEILLRRLREASFRYFHPELNSSAGRDGASISGDPDLLTAFPFMNWSGGYGWAVAEEMIRKFDHYRRCSCIALSMGEPIVKIDSSEEGVMVSTARRAPVQFDLAIDATGFGREKGSDLTNDESYWHSGNPRGYRALTIRARRSRERILISGNGDSGVIELAHCLIRDFRHEDIFRFLAHNRHPSQLGQWYQTVQASLPHRRILSAALDDEDERGLPRATGVLAWYWTMRELAESNPHISTFQGRPPGSTEPTLYSLIHSQLNRYRTIDRVARGKLAQVEELASEKLAELASADVANVARDVVLQGIPRKAIEQVIRTDVRVTMIGRSPTVYSMHQAPLNWFLLALLERSTGFEYIHGRLTRRAKIVGNHVQTQFGRFDRVIVRHGPDFKSFGRSRRFGRRIPSIVADSTHQLLTHWVVDRDRKRFRDVFLEHFRSKRWRESLRHNGGFEDSRERELHLREPSVEHRKADEFLLVLRGTPSQAKAITLYRRFKRAQTPEDRSAVLIRLMTLTLREIKLRGHLLEPNKRPQSPVP